MPFVVRPHERLAEDLPGGGWREWVIAPDRLADHRLSVSVLHLRPGSVVEVATSAAGKCPPPSAQGAAPRAQPKGSLG